MDPLSHLNERPTWRGWMHAWACVVAIPAGVLLVIAAPTTAATAAASIYAASLVLLFGTSAAYHRLARSERTRRTMQRIDHAMIYVLIVGTYVPLCVLALPPAWGIPILVVVAAAGVLGIVLKLAAFHGARWLSYSLYLIMGWAAVIAAPVMIDNLTTTQLTLVIAGGVAYTIGFPVLMTRWPNPWPQRFGYHEVWHLLTVVAAGLHFAAVSDVVA
ncbi:MAG: hemolysin III family protein [Actinomycetota bacterium]